MRICGVEAKMLGKKGISCPDEASAQTGPDLGYRLIIAKPVVSECWWKKKKASSSNEFAQRLALAGRRVKEDDAHGKG
jgi:hypothetical protein